ncbi:unnamed protein product [Calypogeia fissa]
MKLGKSTVVEVLICLLQVVFATPDLTSATKTSAVVSIDPRNTYLLPHGFVGNLTLNFIDTFTSDGYIAELFSAAKKAPFITYDPEFLHITGDRPNFPQLIAQRDDLFADEAGVWVPDKNQVWFTSATVNNAGNLSILDLETSTIFRPNTSIPLVTPNGGYFFDGKVYFTGQGTANLEPCIYAVNTNTYETETVINSYFGLRFGGPNDVTWAIKRGQNVDRNGNKNGNNKSFMFFSDEPQSYVFAGGLPPVLPNAVWRYDPDEQSIVPVISRADILVPNGVAVNADSSKLFVTDTPFSAVYVPADTPSSGSPAIYSFDLDEDGFPINKRMVGIARSGIPDGIKIDDAGRIWTGEGEGIVVRNPRGKILGVFNSEFFLESYQTEPPIANFALAGDTLVVLAMQRVWTLKLAQTVVSAERYRR